MDGCDIMTMKKLHEFAPGAVEQTLWAAKQMIGESISLNNDPIEWVYFFAEMAEIYGEI